jgi:hypothetical protein
MIAVKAPAVYSPPTARHQEQQQHGTSKVAAGRPRLGSSFYTKAKDDRSGSSIRDMLFALAYGFANNRTYLGACYVSGTAPTMHAAPPGGNASRYHPQKMELIRALGLGDVLRFACPDAFHSDDVLPEDEYLGNSTFISSTDFLRWLWSQAKNLTSPQDGRDGGAVVHVRRGDLGPCARRYLPNSYYLHAIERYIPPDVPVTIYSESASVEPWHDFERLNYTVQLEANVTDIWRAIATAKYVVLSQSSFAYVPAVTNGLPNATTVFARANRLFVPMPHWTQADREILSRAQKGKEEIAGQRCGGRQARASGSPVGALDPGLGRFPLAC